MKSVNFSLRVLLRPSLVGREESKTGVRPPRGIMSQTTAGPLVGGSHLWGHWACSPPWGSHPAPAGAMLPGGPADTTATDLEAEQAQPPGWSCQSAQSEVLPYTMPLCPKLASSAAPVASPAAMTFLPCWFTVNSSTGNALCIHALHAAEKTCAMKTGGASMVSVSFLVINSQVKRGLEYTCDLFGPVFKTSLF